MKSQAVPFGGLLKKHPFNHRALWMALDSAKMAPPTRKCWPTAKAKTRCLTLKKKPYRASVEIEMTNQSDAERLEPCPFCGSADTYAMDMGGWESFCKTCGTNGPALNTERDKVIADWNTRAARNPGAGLSNRTIGEGPQVAAPDAPQPATNEADELLTALNLGPDAYRTDGGWLNIPKIKAAIASPEDYPYIAQPAIQAVTPCQNESMGKHACTNRAQCWEPCGELGHSAEHARPSERNFCGRCGKRLSDSEYIHTCTPPAAVQPAEPLTIERKRYIVTTWFAEGWAIDKALSLIDDIEAAHNIKPKASHDQ